MKTAKKLAVKIQYPGVANSISSDLALVKLLLSECLIFKVKILINILKVEDKLIEETNYLLGLEQSQDGRCSLVKKRILRFQIITQNTHRRKLSQWTGWTGFTCQSLKMIL
jgi:hypothetical protein